MGHSSGQCTIGQDAEEDDYEHSLSASCLSCKKHTDVDGRDRAANRTWGLLSWSSVAKILLSTGLLFSLSMALI